MARPSFRYGSGTPILEFLTHGEDQAGRDAGLATEAGSWRSTVNPNRWRFHCIRVEEPECFDPDDRVLVFYWYNRSRSR